MKEWLSTNLRLPKVYWLVFLVCGIAIYGFTLGYPFVFDDRIYILGNPLLASGETFLDAFDLDEFLEVYLDKAAHRDMVTSFLLRPVTYLSFQANFLLFGSKAASFRAFNIGVHIANAILLYRLLLAIINRRRDLPPTLPPAVIPFFAALLFLVHPLQTQSVTYITQRFTSLATFFYLATMLLYVKATAAASGTGRRVLYWGSVLTLLVGLFTKEIIFTVPLALLLVETLLLRRPWRTAAKSLIPHLLCIGFIPFQVIRLSEELRDDDHLLSSATDIVGGIYSRADYAITQLKVVLDYLRLLLVPYGQNFDPDYPLYHSLFQPQIMLALLVWSLLLLAGIRLYRRRGRDIGTDLTLFSLCWFPLAISVSSSIIPLTDLMFEHRTYLPSAAFFTGVVAFLCTGTARFAGRRLTVVRSTLCLAAVVLALLTVQRNRVFGSRIGLWQDTVAKSPKKARPAFALGNAYLDRKRYAEAIDCFDRALDIKPTYFEPYLSLGTAYLQLGMPEKAVDLYEEYLEVFTPRKRIMVNLALAYSQLGNYLEALRTLNPIVDDFGGDAKMLAFVSELNLRLGRLDESRQFLARAMEADRLDKTVDLSTVIPKLEDAIREAVGISSRASS